MRVRRGAPAHDDGERQLGYGYAEVPVVVRLFCPRCVYNVAQGNSSSAYVDVPVPIARLADNGLYDVRCDAGHVTPVILDNLKFELLFDLALNAILDGYPREGVATCASALERFYEFFWRVAMRHVEVPDAQVHAAWKLVSAQSERQLGAFVAAHLALVHASPPLLRPKMVELRNGVVHKGYVPTDQEAVDFADAVMLLMNEPLDRLRGVAPEALRATYDALAPATAAPATAPEELRGVVNVLTAIDVRHPPLGEDMRVGDTRQQFKRIQVDRGRNRMEHLTAEEFTRRFPGQQLRT